MKRLFLISALLFSFNGWAECSIDDDYVVWKKCIDKERAKAESKTKKQSKSKKVIKKRIVSEINGLITQLNRVEGVTELDKKVARSPENYALSFGIGRNNTLAYGLCSNYETKILAMNCAEVFCRKIGNNCRSVQTNNAYANNGLEHSQMIMERLGWDPNRSNQSNNDTMLSRWLRMKADESERRQREYKSQYKFVITIDSGRCDKYLSGARLVKSEKARYNKTVCYYR